MCPREHRERIHLKTKAINPQGLLRDNRAMIDIEEMNKFVIAFRHGNHNDFSTQETDIERHYSDISTLKKEVIPKVLYLMQARFS